MSDGEETLSKGGPNYDPWMVIGIWGLWIIVIANLAIIYSLLDANGFLSTAEANRLTMAMSLMLVFPLVGMVKYSLYLIDGITEWRAEVEPDE